MRSIKQLQNQDGSTLLLAIVVLLIATVLGGIVVSAAAANLSRANQTSEEQAYLTAESTALLFREMMSEQELHITEDEDGNKLIQAVGGNDLSATLVADLEQIMGLGGTPQNSVARTIDLDVSEVTANQQVQALYIMNVGYGVEFQIGVYEGGKLLSRLVAEFPASTFTDEHGSTMVWSDGAITRPSGKGVGG